MNCPFIVLVFSVGFQLSLITAVSFDAGLPLFFIYSFRYGEDSDHCMGDLVYLHYSSGDCGA